MTTMTPLFPTSIMTHHHQMMTSTPPARWRWRPHHWLPMPMLARATTTTTTSTSSHANVTMMTTPQPQQWGHSHSCTPMNHPLDLDYKHVPQLLWPTTVTSWTHSTTSTPLRLGQWWWCDPVEVVLGDVVTMPSETTTCILRLHEYIILVPLYSFVTEN